MESRIKMEQLTKIVVALDFSDYSPPVMAVAARLARETGAELIAVNVINKRDVDAVRMVEHHDARISVKSYVADVKKQRTALLNELIAAGPAAGLAVKKIFLVDVPFRGILKTVSDETADMLVMGTKGRGNLADALFGSTAEKVFRRCPVSLLSVRTKEAE